MVKYLFLALLLSGCSASPKIKESEPSRPVDVIVPVQCPSPREVIRPSLDYLSTIDKDTEDGEVIRRYRIGLQEVKSYARELETIINGYRAACASSEGH